MLFIPFRLTFCRWVQSASAGQAAQKAPLFSGEEVMDLRNMILAMVDEPLVLVVKLADRLHNMRTVFALRPDRQRAVAAETMQVWCSLAERLGMFSLKVSPASAPTLMPPWAAVRYSRHEATVVAWQTQTNPNQSGHTPWARLITALVQGHRMAQRMSGVAIEVVSPCCSLSWRTFASLWSARMSTGPSGMTWTASGAWTPSQASHCHRKTEERTPQSGARAAAATR